MAFEKDNKYWKIVEFKANVQLKKATITLVGFKDKEDSKGKLAQHIPGYTKKQITLEKADYPFTNDATPNQLAQAYKNCKKDKYFKEAKDV